MTFSVYATEKLERLLSRKSVDDVPYWILDFGAVPAGAERSFRLFVENASLTPIENFEVSTGAIVDKDIELTLYENKTSHLDGYDAHEFHTAWKITTDAIPGKRAVSLVMRGRTTTENQDFLMENVPVRDRLLLRFDVIDEVSQPARSPFKEALVAGKDSRRDRSWRCSFFEDDRGDSPVSVIDFGEVWEKDTRTKKVWIRNDDLGLIRELDYIVLRNDVRVVGPSALEKGATGLLTLAWTPGDDVHFGLKDELKIEGTLVID